MGKDTKINPLLFFSKRASGKSWQPTEALNQKNSVAREKARELMDSASLVSARVRAAARGGRLRAYSCFQSAVAVSILSAA